MINYIVSITAILLIILSLLFKPEIKIKNHSIMLYWLIALFGAIALIIFGSVSLNEIWQSLTAKSEINPLKLLVIFFSMTVLSVFLDEMGFFKYMANLTLKKCKSNQKKLFLFLFIMVSVLTIFTSNDIIILTFTPFIIFFSKNAKINPLPYLIAEFVGANTLSMALIIGNPTNIYIATSFNIGFFEYFKIMFLPCTMSAITGYFVLYLIFKKELNKEITPEINEIVFEDKFLLYNSIIHLALCILMLSISSFLNFEMWYICLGFAISLLTISILYIVIKKQKLTLFKRVLKRLPYELIPFVLSMFIIVLSLSKTGINQKICEILGTNNTIFSYGISSYICANLINNIPMSMFFVEILNNLSVSVQGGVFASIIGSNIGAYLSPIGALAGIMWLKILHNEKIDLTFVKFIKYGILISLPVIIIALSFLSISLLIFA